MKLEELKVILRKEIRTVLREELKDLLAEAVEIASRPTVAPQIPQGPRPKPQVFFEEEPRMMSTAPNLSVDEGFDTGLASTVAYQMGLMTEEAGIDLSKLGFVKKASTILKKAEQYGKED